MPDTNEPAVDWAALAAELAEDPPGTWRFAVIDAEVQDFLDARAEGLLTHHGNRIITGERTIALWVCLPKPLPREEPLDTSSEYYSDWNTYEIDEEFRAFRVKVLKARLERAPRRLAKLFGERLSAIGTDQREDARDRHERETDDTMKRAYIQRAEIALLLGLDEVGDD